jgi:cytosine deaminase
VLIDRIERARIDAGSSEVDLTLAAGRVAAISCEDGAGLPALPPLASGRLRDAGGAGPPVFPPARGNRLDAGGRALVPGFVDAHVHLDKAFLLERSGTCAPQLSAAIEAVAGLRSELSLELVRANARRALELLIQNGVTAARVHVEIDDAVGLELLQIQRTLALELEERISLQLVAFPQRGLARPGVLQLMAAAMDEGAAVVGGCPYVDRDPAWHLDQVFALAERHAAPIDLHLDFSDDVGSSLLGLVAERVRAHGLAGRVTIGHVTTLAAMAPDVQSAALEQLAETGISLVLLPATDLYLAGHGEPGTRSLAPFERARAAGVRVAIANNNLQNPFAPFGNGNLVQAAWLTAIMRRAAEPALRAALLEAIGREPAAILGLPLHGPSLGARADFALLDVERVEDIVLLAPPVLATLRGGCLTYRREALPLMAAESGCAVV